MDRLPTRWPQSPHCPRIKYGPPSNTVAPITSGRGGHQTVPPGKFEPSPGHLALRLLELAALHAAGLWLLVRGRHAAAALRWPCHWQQRRLSLACHCLVLACHWLLATTNTPPFVGLPLPPRRPVTVPAAPPPPVSSRAAGLSLLGADRLPFTVLPPPSLSRTAGWRRELCRDGGRGGAARGRLR